MRNLFLSLAIGTVALFLIVSCKDTSTNVNISQAEKTIGAAITSDTVGGSVKGTMLANHTYYFYQDININAGDTLLMQSGVTLIALPVAAGAATPQISVEGTFISLGTQAAPNWITVPVASRTYANLFNGLWGGIQGDISSGDIIVKWTHLEYAGGPAGNGNMISNLTAGKTRYGICPQNRNANFILEDSWMRGTPDDGIRVNGGKISVMRNSFEWCGLQGGDAFNVKGNTVGDIAYNVWIGTCTNGPKLSNKGATGLPETNCNIYNNTMVNCGWRMVETGRAGSTDIEENARGTEYNNLIVNCRTGFRLLGITPAADTSNTFYDYQYYYGQADSIRLKFYPSDGVQLIKSHDIQGATKANDPQFVKYDVNQFDFTQSNFQWPINYTQVPYGVFEFGNADFHLKSTSPAIGKGTTVPTTTAATVPLKVCPQGGDLGATTLSLGKDIGAYQSDGSGNQH